MSVGKFSHFAASGRSFDEAFLDEERLVDLFDCACIFSDGSSYRVDSHGSSLEFVDDGGQDLVVYLVETIDSVSFLSGSSVTTGQMSGW